ncbi:hypothetical protein MLD38_012972 [Melastoma candidum]|uniref:Uncharacterized protein n=1 Tax=Melastoma candidum TaxID=119954 RepID=A0ACB9R823_9MYRT|nr:hypothetical protein MLD38_012972 [Melastoma candidum]
MFSSFICGGSFHEQEPEDDRPLSCGSSPRSINKSRTRRNCLLRRCSSDKDHSKNPYSTVGLDKFSALLSDLEERKKNIYLQRDSQDIMFVRFVYSGSEEVVPVIVKSKDRKKREQLPTTSQKTANSKTADEENKPAVASAVVADRVKEELTETNDKKVANSHKTRTTRETSMKKLRRPSYYVPIFVVAILLLLTIFGRSFAILCTSIGWYLVPTLEERTSG